MKNTMQVYVLTLNAPSRKTVRLWTGASIHSLRHCSSKKIDRTLAEMQQHVDDLQRAIRVRGDGRIIFHQSLSIMCHRGRCLCRRKTFTENRGLAIMPDDAEDKKVHAGAKPASCTVTETSRWRSHMQRIPD